MPTSQQPEPPPTSFVSEGRAATEVLAEATRWAVAFQTMLAPAEAAAKADASPVTAADLAVQAIIVAALRERGLQDEVVGEESTAVFRLTGGLSLRERVREFVARARGNISLAQLEEAIDAGGGSGRADRHWVVDPIDGTRGYIGGQQYCVCLAFVDCGRVVYGGAGCPRLGRQGILVHATRGAGAWAHDGLNAESQTRRLAARSALGESVVATESTDAGDRARRRLRALAESLAPTVTTIAMESQCKFVLVATGDSDLAVRFPPRDPSLAKDMVWDYAGAVVMAEEAGARMTGCDGEALVFGQGRAIAGNKGILCAARWAHPLAIAHLNSTGGVESSLAREPGHGGGARG